MNQHHSSRAGWSALIAGLVALTLGFTVSPALAQDTGSDADQTAAQPADSSAPGGEESAVSDETEATPDVPAKEEPKAAKAADDARASRKRVGVMEIRTTGMNAYYNDPAVNLGNTVRLSPPPNFTDGLTEILITELVAQGRYQVLERAKINEVLAEQDLATAGRIDPATAAATGKVTGAQILITGDVTEFSYESKAVGGGLGILKKKAQIGGGVGKITAKLALDLRMIDATTGEVLGSSRGEGKASTTGLAADFAQADKQLGVGGAKQTPLGKATRQAVANSLEELAKNVP
jgi:curli biogenesis system outer membrane secretion channel CsgG